jgi:hypothetical protein
MAVNGGIWLEQRRRGHHQKENLQMAMPITSITTGWQRTVGQWEERRKLIFNILTARLRHDEWLSVDRGKGPPAWGVVGFGSGRRALASSKVRSSSGHARVAGLRLGQVQRNPLWKLHACRASLVWQRYDQICHA